VAARPASWPFCGQAGDRDSDRPYPDRHQATRSRTDQRPSALPRYQPVAAKQRHLSYAA